MVEELFSPENQIVNIIFIAITILLVMSISIVLFFYFSRNRIKKTQLEKANLVISHQKEIFRSTIITQEEERKRIAQDLHDAISSKLNIVSLNANFLSKENITSTEANNFGNSILKVTTTILESSRKIAHELLPPTLQKFGLEAAIEELYEELYDTQKYKINYSVSYAEKFLSSDNELHLFRIVQELMSNSIKYAEATTLTFLLETKKNSLYLQYNDDGKGIDLNNIQKIKGLGMIGIENRVAILNGKLNIDTSPNNGITVTIELNR